MGYFILVDCNNFFVSCERVFRPELHGKPVCVLSSNDGCIIARSSEAKKAGIPMGAPYFQWRKVLDDMGATVLSGNHDLYKDMSSRVMHVLEMFGDPMEVYSVDEAFLYYNGSENRISYAKQIIDRVYRCTGIPVSVGIASTKTLAKLANHIAKKYKEGCFEIHEDNHQKVLEWCSVDKVWGFGRQTVGKLRRLGLHKVSNLLIKPDGWIRKQLSISGLQSVLELRGISCLPVTSFCPAQKSILCSRSFGQKITDFQDIRSSVATHTATAAEKLRRQGLVARQIGTFLETSRFAEASSRYAASRVHVLEKASSDTSQLIKGALKNLQILYRSGYAYKKSGVFLMDIVPQDQIQYDLFGPVRDMKNQSLMRTIDHINASFSRGIGYGVMASSQRWKSSVGQCSPRYTTQWKEIKTLFI